MSEGIIDLASVLLGGPTGASLETEPYTPLVYPLALPAVSGVQDIIWSRDEVRGISESPFTLHRQVFRHAGERLRASVVLPVMTREDASEWYAFLLALDGGYGTFLFGDVFRPTPRGLAWGSPKVAGASQTGRVLATKDWNANITNILRAGDFIQVGLRLYVVERNVNSDVSGNATLDIFPRLRESPIDNQTIDTTDARGVFQLATPGGPFWRHSAASGLSELYSFEVIESF